MTKEEFAEIEKENAYIYNVLAAHEEQISKRVKHLFDGLYENIKSYGFHTCVHNHDGKISISVFDEKDTDRQKLTIENLKVVSKSNHFNPLVLDLVEIWLRDL